ncbi:MAG: oligosaccharide flippase family protein [candidate division Zixibacteria bacterium]|nr:oligosaccharide flippase family protein [candidate division Zixibacteria bacterium]
MSRLFSNTLISSLDSVVLIALSLVATPILVNNFGVSGYGVFVFLSIFSIHGALSFMDLGMEASLMTAVARFDADGNTRDIQSALNVSLVYYLALGLLVGCILFLLKGMILEQFLESDAIIAPEHIANAVGLIALNLVFQFVGVPFSAVLQGMSRFIISKSVSMTLNILQYALLIAVALWNGRIDIAFAAITGLSLLRLLVYLVLFRIYLPGHFVVSASLDMGLFRKLASYSSVLFFGRFMSLINGQIDKVLIWLMLPVAGLAIYDIVNRPGNLVRMITGMTYSAAVPEVARLHQISSMPSIKDIYLRLVRYAYLLILPALAGLYILMEDLLYLWVGTEFSQYSHLALIVLGIFTINPIVSIASTLAIGMNMANKSLRISCVGVVVNIILSLSLVGKYGIAGLLIGTLTADFVMVIPFILIMNRTLNINWREFVVSLAPLFALGIVCCAGHLIVKALFSDSLSIRMTLSGIIVTCHYLISCKYLLNRNERSFLLVKAGIGDKSLQPTMVCQ